MEGKVTKHINSVGIGTISFYHPSHNALPGYLLKALSNAIHEYGKDPSVKIILVKSEGDRTFCAGASFDELLSIQEENEGTAFFAGFGHVINALRTCGKITIGRIHGKAVGGGVGLCAAVDYAIATKWASVKLSELTLGIGPFVIGSAVERKMGKSAFVRMALNAEEWQTAAWAEKQGLFQEVFESHEQMDAYIESFTGRLAGYNPYALAAMKRIFWEGTADWDALLKERAALSGKLVLSEYSKEAIGKLKKSSGKK